MTNYAALAKQVILATGGDLKRLDEVASVIEASIAPAAGTRRTLPVMVPDKISASGYRVEHLSTEIDPDLAKVLDACAIPSSGGGGEMQTRGVPGPQSAPDQHAPLSGAGVAPGPSDL